MEGFVADRALECLVCGVRQSMALVVALLVESLATQFADKWLDAGVDASMSVECR